MTGILRVFLCLLLAACAAGRPGTILDLERLPQDAGYYLHDPSRVFIAPERQAVLYRDFVERFFGPWHRRAPKYGADEVFSGFRRYASRPLYGETNLPLGPDWLAAMAGEANIHAYPSANMPAVAVVHASLRVFPTHRPVFLSPSAPGDGFPFDQMQNSLVAAGTPLRVTHVSRSGQWALVETDWAAGWVRWQEIALADADFIGAYTTESLIGFWADQVPVTGRDGRFLLSGRVGMALPHAADALPDGHWTVRVAARDHLGRARILEGTVPREAGGRLPFPASHANAARLLNALMGAAYGWGGLYENRDCSALIQDVLGCFGIALPRNSKDQAGAGRWVPLGGLQRQEKERRIRQEGEALLTVLYMPGHVMLYLGQDPVSGRAVVYHSMWGLKTLGLLGKEPGRWVLGRTVITSLEPGREMPGVPSDSLLIDHLTGMARLDR